MKKWDILVYVGITNIFLVSRQKFTIPSGVAKEKVNRSELFFFIRKENWFHQCRTSNMELFLLEN